MTLPVSLLVVVCLFPSRLIGDTKICAQVERRRKERKRKTSKSTDERLLKLGPKRIGELVNLTILPGDVFVAFLVAEALVSKAEAVETGRLVAAQAADHLEEAVRVAVEQLGRLLWRRVHAHAAGNVYALNALALAQHRHDGHGSRLGVRHDIHTAHESTDSSAGATEESHKRVGLLELKGDVVQDGLCSGEDLSCDEVNESFLNVDKWR